MLPFIGPGQMKHLNLYCVKLKREHILMLTMKCKKSALEKLVLSHLLERLLCIISSEMFDLFYIKCGEFLFDGDYEEGQHCSRGKQSSRKTSLEGHISSNHY